MHTHHILSLATTSLLALAALTATTSCESDTIAVNLAPEVRTLNVTDVTRTSATISGEISAPEAVVNAYGILYDRDSRMGNANSVACDAPFESKGAFNVSLSDLAAGTTYYYCAYASSGYNEVRGEVLSFTTPSTSGPSFHGTDVTEVLTNAVAVSTPISDNGGIDIRVVGYIYKPLAEGEDPNITFSDRGVTDQAMTYDGAPAFAASISGLSPNTRYVIRPYGISADVGYGAPVIVSTHDNYEPLLGEVNIQRQQNVLTLHSNITKEGASAVTERGFVYSSTLNVPSLENNDRLIPVDLNGTFTAAIDIDPNVTHYYIRAYARNEQGVGYSAVQDVMPGQTITETIIETEYVYVDVPYTEPFVHSVVAAQVTESSAMLYGYLNTNSCNVLEAGFEFEGELIPVTNKSGTFRYEVTGLDPATTYHFRTFLVDGEGEQRFGEECTFTTTAKKVPGQDDAVFPETKNVKSR